jgi:hypothetical protein
VNKDDKKGNKNERKKEISYDDKLVRKNSNGLN